MLTNLREAITAGDANAIERAAHKLKGSVGNFLLTRPSRQRWKLEVLGRDGSLSEAEPVYAELETEINRLNRRWPNYERNGIAPMKSLDVLRMTTGDAPACWKRILEGWGYEVCTAADGAEALRIFEARPCPDIALLDWVMPEKDGPDSLPNHPREAPDVARLCHPADRPRQPAKHH